MKLLGRLNRGPKGKDGDNFSQSMVSTPDRRKRQNQQKHRQQPLNPTTSPINLALQQNLPKQYQKRQSGRSKSSKIAFTTNGNQNDDNSTLDGNQSLYNWSLADNAPSIGSAGHLFDDQESFRHVSRKKKLIKRNWFQGVGGGKMDRNKNPSGDCSSSDEDDEFDDSFEIDEADFTQNKNFQYAMLSDSPPPKSSCSNGSKNDDDENTPERNETNRGKMYSEKVKEKTPSPPYPIQKANNEKVENSTFSVSSSNPVDVDAFIGIVTPDINEFEMKPTRSDSDLELQHNRRSCGKVTPDINGIEKKTTRSDSDLELKHSHRSSASDVDMKSSTIEGSDGLPSGLKASIIRTVSLEESVNADSLFNELYDLDSLEDISNASMRNLVDSSSPYAKQGSNPAQHDFPSEKQTEVIQKRFANNINDDPFDKDWPLDANSNEKDLLWKKRQIELNNIESEIETDALSAIKKEKSKKKAITNRMKKKLYHLVGTKSKSSDARHKHGNAHLLSRSLSEFSMKPLTGIEKYGSHVPKANLSRSLSTFSMNPLTGIEEGFVKRNAKSRKEIMLEIQRRKDVEKKEIEQKLQKRTSPTIFENGDREESNSDTTGKLNESASEDATCRHKDILQQWVSRCSNLRFEDRPQNHFSESNYDDSNDFQSNYSPSKFSHGAVTTRIDNRRSQNRRTKSKSMHMNPTKESISFATNFPDDESTSDQNRVFLHL